MCGGGFPIRLKGSGLVLGCIAASGLDEIGDHEFVAGSLREFLNMPDVPALRR
ncbi:MAG: heme-binding protein [Lachnospiraceae bacterium]|nr:heme-binding protein [Lachnospiraceae bacterium]